MTEQDSYLERIAKALDGKEEDDLLAEKGYMQRITEAVETGGGVAKVGYDIFTGEQAFGAYADNKMMTFTIVGKDCRPLSTSYVFNTSIATIDFSIGGVIKRYTLDNSGNFAEVV